MWMFFIIILLVVAVAIILSCKNNKKSSEKKWAYFKQENLVFIILSSCLLIPMTYCLIKASFIPALIIFIIHISLFAFLAISKVVMTRKKRKKL